MGLGGHLMWTPLAREVVRHTAGISKVFPVECFGSSSPTMQNVVFVKSEMFRNNPNFCDASFVSRVPIVLNDPRTNYCKSDTPERCIQRHDKHVIHQICEFYGIKDVALQCDLYLTDAELAVADEMPYKEFITIDPHTKNEYTVNKEYPFEKWQRVVDAISNVFPIVQVGRKTDKVLQNAYDFTGQTTFREAAGIVGRSMLYVGPEGGLMHAANAVGTPAVILITGFLHPTMTCYPDNTNIWLGDPARGGHGPCGMKVRCEKCFTECQTHDETELIEAVLKRLRG